MPHIPRRFKPAPGTVAPRATAPLMQPDPAFNLPELPADDLFDLPVDNMPVRTAKPDVPFAAPRRREHGARNPLMPVISMARHSVPVADVEAHMFPPAVEPKR